MPEKVMPGPVEDSCGIREAVCIHTRKIFDSCRDKDCIEDLRFYPKLQLSLLHILLEPRYAMWKPTGSRIAHRSA